MQCGLVVLVGASILVQIRSLAELSIIFLAGIISQLVAIGLIVYELVSNPDPEAKHSNQAVTVENAIPASVALMNIIFAFGGQFAFIEIMGSMKRQARGGSE